MKELAEVKSSVLQLHKGAEKRLEAFIQVTILYICVRYCALHLRLLGMFVTIVSGRA